MRSYRQLTPGERYELSALRKQGFRPAHIARALGRHRSTICREIRRNSRDGTGRQYRPGEADDQARWRRSRSRRNQRFGPHDWALVLSRLRDHWSPEQISGRFRRTRTLSISHETIYRYIWADWRHGGSLHLLLRGARKKRWKRCSDTMVGNADQHAVLTLVDRKTGYLLVGKLTARNAAQTAQRTISLLRQAPSPVRTVTVDNGTEFHNYRDVERATGARFYFATPHHSWERGTSENTNGLLRQYLPKKTSMANISQRTCTRLAQLLNDRPRKRLGYLTPKECYDDSLL